MAAAAPEFERIVRDAMEQRSLSMLQLGRESRIPPQRWYTWFRGENRPTARVLNRATGALGVSLDELLAPYGGAGPGIVTDPGLAALTQAINRLADVLGGEIGGLAAELAEGTARARSRASAGRRRPERSPR